MSKSPYVQALICAFVSPVAIIRFPDYLGEPVRVLVEVRGGCVSVESCPGNN